MTIMENQQKNKTKNEKNNVQSLKTSNKQWKPIKSKQTHQNNITNNIKNDSKTTKITEKHYKKQ